MSDLSSESDIESSPHQSSDSEVENVEAMVDVESDVEDVTSKMPVHGASEAEGRSTRGRHGVDRDAIQPYAEEPVPTTVWLQQYNERRNIWLQDQEELTKRLENRIQLHEWCKCGKCNIEHLENPRECRCCTELEKCENALNDEWVKEEVMEKPSCIVEHPGFQVVCLNRWSLKLAADKYKTLRNKKYKNTGVEKRFFRAVAYREFTRLVHGKLGHKRIPLPACAYHSIRSLFSVDGNTGFNEVQQMH